MKHLDFRILFLLGTFCSFNGCTYNPMAADGVSVPSVGSWFVFEEILSRNGTIVSTVRSDTISFLIHHNGLHGRTGVTCAFSGYKRYGPDTVFIHYQRNGDFAVTTAAGGRQWNIYPFQSREPQFVIIRDSTWQTGENERIVREIRHVGSEAQVLPNGDSFTCSIVHDTETHVFFNPQNRPIRTITTLHELWYNRSVGYPSKIITTTTTADTTSTQVERQERTLVKAVLHHHDN
ncbi:MAG: hypothetical protein MUC47_09515 [Candidatus Kapabacteria bacterium]|nr:hypothetical protein [Candidatus Kapabacteria bacterium]